jgi:predicted nucleic-acid-binding Zn-ribbon protein
MKDGKCPRCGSDEVYESTSKLDHRSRRVLALLSNVGLNEVICCGCGLMETYLSDMQDVEKVKANCTKVKPTE